MPTEVELAYLAGIVDGEGCFVWSWGNSTMLMNVQMKHEPTIDWLHTTFGGSRFRPTNTGLHTWKAFPVLLRELLPILRPYMITKAEQADIFLTALQLRTQRGKSTTLEQQRVLYEKLRTLNSRGGIVKL